MRAVRPDGGRLRARRARAFGFALALSACSSPPPPPPPTPPTMAQLKLSASDDVNQTQSGQGAPIVVRVYQLASSSAFEKAEFFRLLNADTAALGDDLVKKDEYLLPPGAKKEQTLAIPDRVQAIGVFAAYREFQAKSWRVVVALPAHKTTPVFVAATASGLILAPAPSP